MRIKLLGALGIIFFVLLFALQNGQTVEIRWLFWQGSAPLALLLFGVFVGGVFLGWVVGSMVRGQRRKRATAGKPPEPNR